MIAIPIVGAFYRPPALQLIAALPPSTPLFLRAEPTNEYDINAIQVILKTKDIPESCHLALTEELAKRGKELNDILEQPEWHLGYVPKETAKTLRENNAVEEGEELEGKFSIRFDGKPEIRFEE